MQFPLADRHKIETLRALPKADLLYTFNSFPPSNPDLIMYLESISGKRNALRFDPMGYIVFRSPDSYPEDGSVKRGARPEVVAGVKAEAGLLRDDAHWQQYAQEIENLLLGMIAKNDVTSAEGPKYFAALATRAAIGHGDYLTALKALRLGFVFDAYDEQLQFLSRVCDRIVPPDVLAKAKAADKFSK